MLNHFTNYRDAKIYIENITTEQEDFTKSQVIILQFINRGFQKNKISTKKNDYCCVQI